MNFPQLSYHTHIRFTYIAPSIILGRKTPLKVATTISWTATIGLRAIFWLWKFYYSFLATFTFLVPEFHPIIIGTRWWYWICHYEMEENQLNQLKPQTQMEIQNYAKTQIWMGANLLENLKKLMPRSQLFNEWSFMSIYT